MVCLRLSGVFLLIRIETPLFLELYAAKYIWLKYCVFNFLCSLSDNLVSCSKHTSAFNFLMWFIILVLFVSELMPRTFQLTNFSAIGSDFVYRFSYCCMYLNIATLYEAWHWGGKGKQKGKTKPIKAIENKQGDTNIKTHKNIVHKGGGTMVLQSEATGWQGEIEWIYSNVQKSQATIWFVVLARL